MSEIIKQEGDFKIQKRKPKNLNAEQSLTKVDLSTPAKEADVTKVVIPNTPEETPVEQPEVIVVENTGETIVMEEIPNEVVETPEPVIEPVISQKVLPENIEKISFFHGGDWRFCRRLC